jgi:uncharacterized Zn-finger protein
MKTHSKPHQCDVCNRGFALRLDLSRHVKARHQLGHERYPCPMSTDCKFEATRKDNLRQHCFKIHKLVPGAQLTNAENTKELETSKHRVVPEEAVWPKPANRSHGDRHS